MNLASQIAENDPQTALRIAEDYLNGKLDYQVSQPLEHPAKKRPEGRLGVDREDHRRLEIAGHPG